MTVVNVFAHLSPGPARYAHVYGYDTPGHCHLPRQQTRTPTAMVSWIIRMELRFCIKNKMNVILNAMRQEIAVVVCNKL